MRRALAKWMTRPVAAVLLGLPLPAVAHSADIVLARLLLHDGPEVTLELTADVIGNPWLKDAPNPAAALGKALRVSLPDGRSWTVGQLGNPTVTLSEGFSHPAPVPLTHNADEPIPELFTAAWTWRPSSTPLRFEVDPGIPHSIVFWAVSPTPGRPLPGWRMLLAGDRSNPINLPLRPQPLVWNWKARAAVVVALTGLALQGLLIVLRIQRARLSGRTPSS